MKTCRVCVRGERDIDAALCMLGYVRLAGRAELWLWVLEFLHLGCAGM